METVLAFFSDLILFTAGLLVATLWIVIIVGAGIELYDLIRKKGPGFDDKNEEPF